MDAQAKKKFDISLIPGVLGMLLIIYGTQQPLGEQSIFFVCGSLMMLLPALVKRHLFFISLQIIAATGAASAFIPASAAVQASVPVTVTFLFLVTFIYKKQLQDWLDFLGAISITVLAIGYATSVPLVYFIGGLCLVVYSAVSLRRGIKISWLWLILNCVFSVSAGITLFKIYQ